MSKCSVSQRVGGAVFLSLGKRCQNFEGFPGTIAEEKWLEGPLEAAPPAGGMFAGDSMQ